MMTTQSSPIITDMKVIPVAGHDSMLLNIGGAHNAYFTRNIVVLTDNAGNTGVGEAPGGEVIYQTLVEAIPMVLGQEIARQLGVAFTDTDAEIERAATMSIPEIFARDGEAYRPHWQRWAAQERALYAADRTRESADVIVRT